MKTYTKEDEKYFEEMQLHGGVLSWDDRQELQDYLDWKKAEEMKECDYCKGSGYDPYDNWGAIHEPCPRCSR